MAPRRPPSGRSIAFAVRPPATRRRLLGRAAVGGLLATGAASGCAPEGSGSAPAERKPATLQTWHTMRPGPTLDAFNEILREYQAVRPEISFDLTFVPGGSGPTAEYHQKLTAAVAADTPPDIAHISPPPSMGAAGLLEELTAFVKRDRSFNPADIFDAPWTRCTFQDKVWGVPVICDDRGIWLNKALFREVGLDPNRPPATFAEMEQASVRLTRQTGTGYDRIGFVPLFGNSDLYSFIYMNGGEIIRQTGKDRFQVAFTEPAAVEAAEWLVRFYDRVGGWDAVEGYRRTFQSGAQNPFFLGHVAMMRQGSWFTAEVKNFQTQIDYGLAPEPVGPSGKGPATLVGGYNWGLARKTKHAESGWAFLSWFSQPGPSVKYAAAQGNMPARKSAVTSDYIQKNSDVRFFFEALKYGRPFPTYPWTVNMSGHVNTEAQNNIVQKKMGPKQALEEAGRKVQADIDAYLAQAKR